MKILWKFFLVLILLTACQPANTPQALQQSQLMQKGTSGIGLTLKWPQPGFQTKMIPTDTSQIEVEITEVDSFRNLFRTTLTRADVPGDKITQQIRIDMQGAAERNVKLVVTAKNQRLAVVAKGEKLFTLKGGQRSLVQVQILPVQIIIGGGGGGGGGGGPTPSPSASTSPTPFPTPTPTPPPTDYTLTPLSSGIFVNVQQSVDIPLKIWNGTGPYVFHFTGSSLPAGIKIFDSNNTEKPLTSGASFILQAGDTVRLVGSTTVEGSFPLNITYTDATSPTPQSETKAFTLIVRKMVLSPTLLTTPRANLLSSQIIRAFDGVGPYTWTKPQGTLPDGLSLNLTTTGDTLTLSGTPTGAINNDTYRFTVKVTDSLNRSFEQVYVLGCGDNALADFKDAQPIVNTVNIDSGSNSLSATGANSSAHALTVNGSNFNANSQVWIDKLPLNISSRDTDGANDTLVATVPSGLKPGKFNVLVINPDSTVGYIEGGLANAYVSTGSAPAAIPSIGALFSRTQPIIAGTTTDEELQAQLLTYNGQVFPGRDVDQTIIPFLPILIVGANFTAQSRVFVGETPLPSLFVNEGQILTVVPAGQLFPDLSEKGGNALVVYNADLASSDPAMGKMSIGNPNPTVEGSGVSYLGYVYPQKGPNDENVTVFARGCGFERPHSFRLSTGDQANREILQSGIAKVFFKAGDMFPDSVPYDLSVYRVNLGEVTLSDRAEQVYQSVSDEIRVAGCSPEIIAPNVANAITLDGIGFIPGMQTTFIQEDSDPVGAEYQALATTVQDSLLAIPVVSNGMPSGKYKVKVTAPVSGAYPSGASFTTASTCLTIDTLEVAEPPVITELEITVNDTLQSSVSNNEFPAGTIKIKGNFFQVGASVHIGGLQAGQGTGSTTSITLSTDEVLDMAPGDYPIYVTNPDGQVATYNSLTITDGGGLPLGPPQLFAVNPAYPSGRSYYYSMIMVPSDGFLNFTVGNILPGAIAQLVNDPSDPIRPDDAYLTNLFISGNNVTAEIPSLPGGANPANPRKYYLRMVNPDGQYVTFGNGTTGAGGINIVSVLPPEIETDPSELENATLYGGSSSCHQSICPSSGLASQFTDVQINGVYNGTRSPAINFGNRPANSFVQLVHETNSSQVIDLTDITSTDYKLFASVPDGVAPGRYRVRITNPDGQTNDVVNGAGNAVFFEVLSATTKWSKAGKMAKPGEENGVNGDHGRAGASSLVDPDTQKVYFFGGNDARTCYNQPSKRLISYSVTSGWQDLGKMPDPGRGRVSAATAWRNEVSAAQDRLFVFGGEAYDISGPPEPGCNETTIPAVNKLNRVFLNDLWLYKPSTTSWQEFSKDGNFNANALPSLIDPGMHWSSTEKALYIFGGLLAEIRTDLNMNSEASRGYYNSPNIYMLRVVYNDGSGSSCESTECPASGTYRWSVVNPANMGATTSPHFTFDSTTNCPFKPSGATLTQFQGCTRGLYSSKLVSDPDRDRFFIVGGYNYYFKDRNPVDSIITGGSSVGEAVIPTSDSMNNKVWMYDVALNKWAEIANNNPGTYALRFNHAIGLDMTNPKLLVYGGRGASNSLAEPILIGQFSGFTGDADTPPTLTWSSDTSDPPVTRREAHAAAWASNRFFVFGGICGTSNKVCLYTVGSSTYPGTPSNPNLNHDPSTEFWQYIP